MHVTGRIRRDDGSAVVELPLVTIGILLILFLMIAGYRIIHAGSAVQAAAHDAARQASIALAPSQAAAAAQASAQSSLRGNHLRCAPIVSVDTSGFSVPVGQPADVSATVTCTVSLTGLPGFPGSRTVKATFLSPLDRFRQR